MRRGDVVAVVPSGDSGNPQPALVIQSDLFAEHPSVTILPITREWRDVPLFRVALPADESTGLRRRSQVMVDKVQTLLLRLLTSAISEAVQ